MNPLDKQQAELEYRIKRTHSDCEDCRNWQRICELKENAAQRALIADIREHGVAKVYSFAQSNPYANIAQGQQTTAYKAGHTDARRRTLTYLDQLEKQLEDNKDV